MEECKRNYHVNGKLSREYYCLINGKLHREDGPASIYYFPNGKIYVESYYKNGDKHREDGPARTYYNEDGNIEHTFYYLNGKEYTDKDIIDNWEAFCKMQIFR